MSTERIDSQRVQEFKERIAALEAEKLSILEQWHTEVERLREANLRAISDFGQLQEAIEAFAEIERLREEARDDARRLLRESLVYLEGSDMHAKIKKHLGDET